MLWILSLIFETANNWKLDGISLPYWGIEMQPHTVKVSKLERLKTPSRQTTLERRS